MIKKALAWARDNKSLLILLAIAISALASTLAFPPVDCGRAAWFVLVPLLLVILTEKPRAAMNAGFLYGFIFFSVSLRWLFSIFGPQSVILIGICALFIAVIAWLTALVRAKSGTLAAAALFPLIWAGVEFFRCEVWALKFAFLALGFSQHTSINVLQTADTFGVYGLSSLVALSNSAIAYSALAVFQKQHRAHSTFATLSFPAAAALTISTSYLYGFAFLSDAIPVGRSISMLGIQSGALASPGLIDISKRALSKAPERPDLIVWPEYSLSTPIDYNKNMLDDILAFTRQSRTYLLFGGTESTTGNKFQKFRNTAFLISPEGHIAARAVKMNPIQFMEPAEPGKEYSVLRTPFARVGVGICYDMDYQRVSRNIVARGAEVLVFPTADMSTWGREQHLQHAAMAAIRAAETHRYLFRVATSGVSMVIDNKGRVISDLGVGVEGTINGYLVSSNDITFFVRRGYLFGPCCLAIVVLLATVYSIMYIIESKRNIQKAAAGK